MDQSADFGDDPDRRDDPDSDDGDDSGDGGDSDSDGVGKGQWRKLNVHTSHNGTFSGHHQIAGILHVRSNLTEKQLLRAAQREFDASDGGLTRPSGLGEGWRVIAAGVWAPKQHTKGAVPLDPHMQVMQFRSTCIEAQIRPQITL